MTTTLDQTEAAFEKSLPQDGNLPDWNLLRVYADFLEERGREGDAKHAWVLRWMADKGAWPELYGTDLKWYWWRWLSPDHACISSLTGIDDTDIRLLWSNIGFGGECSIADSIVRLVKILDKLGVIPKNL